jgi:hypothetical protein
MIMRGRLAGSLAVVGLVVLITQVVIDASFL